MTNLLTNLKEYLLKENLKFEEQNTGKNVHLHYMLPGQKNVYQGDILITNDGEFFSQKTFFLKEDKSRYQRGEFPDDNAALEFFYKQNNSVQLGNWGCESHPEEIRHELNLPMMDYLLSEKQFRWIIRQLALEMDDAYHKMRTLQMKKQQAADKESTIKTNIATLVESSPEEVVIDNFGAQIVVIKQSFVLLTLVAKCNQKIDLRELEQIRTSS